MKNLKPQKKIEVASKSSGWVLRYYCWRTSYQVFPAWNYDQIFRIASAIV